MIWIRQNLLRYYHLRLCKHNLQMRVEGRALSNFGGTDFRLGRKIYSMAWGWGSTWLDVEIRSGLMSNIPNK